MTMAAVATPMGTSGSTSVLMSTKTPYAKDLAVVGSVTGVRSYVAGILKVTETGETEGVTSGSVTGTRGTTIASPLTSTTQVNPTTTKRTDPTRTPCTEIPFERNWPPPRKKQGPYVLATINAEIHATSQARPALPHPEPRPARKR